MSDHNVAANSSRTARVARALGIVSIAIALAGILGVRLGLLDPLGAFGLFALGAVAGGVSTTLLGVVSLLLTRGGSDLLGRARAWQASAIGAVLVASVLVAGAPGRGAPSINDITTDLDDPPGFEAAILLPENRGRDMAYPEEFVSIVRDAYPDLDSIELHASADEAYAQALGAARALGWEITQESPAIGVFEARATTPIFRFVDDVAVRVRPGAEGAVVDVRSKSRDGRGDLGANATRIRAFTTALPR